jgi:GT2 family glycosyltransferase
MSTTATRKDSPRQGSTPDKSRIAVIILTVNQEQQTLRCLEHLIREQDHGACFDVVLWDNGSSDGTASSVSRAHPNVVVRVSETNLGVAGGRNAAAAAARDALNPDLLLFLDNDMAVAPEFVAALAAPFFGMGGERIGQTQAKLRLAESPDRLNDGGGCRLQLWLGRSRPVGYGETDRGQFDSPARCICCGGAMMVRAPLFHELGGFDEGFNPFGPEDLDFSLRLQEAGYESWYTPDALAYHDVNHTFGAEGYSEDYARHRARHWLRLMRRHASVQDWLGFMLIGAPMIALRVLLREGPKRNFAALRGLIGGTLRSR